MAVLAKNYRPKLGQCHRRVVGQNSAENVGRNAADAGVGLPLTVRDADSARVISEYTWSSSKYAQCREIRVEARYLNSTDLCTFSTEAYARKEVLGLCDTISWSNFGGLQWELVGCLFAAWLVVCLIILGGVKSSGKVVYFTVAYTYVVLVITFAWAVYQDPDGAWSGIKSYLSSDAAKLGEIDTWYEAATQVVYSLSLALGGIVALSSYNRSSGKCQRDVIIIAAIDTATSLFAGLVVFTFLGCMAHAVDIEVAQVAEKISQSSRLVFVIFPKALAGMAVPQLWSTLFFVMVITLSIDTMVVFVQTVTITVLDHFSWYRGYKRLLVAGGTCLLGFLCGLSMVAQGGFFMFELFDASAATLGLLVFAFLEVSFTAWQYGTENFVRNLEEMGDKLSAAARWYYTLCWHAFTPLTLGAVTVFKLIKMVTSGKVFADKEFPAVQFLGFMIFLTSVSMIPVFAVRPIRRKQLDVRNWNLAVDLVHQPLPEWRRRALADQEDLLEREDDV